MKKTNLETQMKSKQPIPPGFIVYCVTMLLGLGVCVYGIIVLILRWIN